MHKEHEKSGASASQEDTRRCKQNPCDEKRYVVTVRRTERDTVRAEAQACGLTITAYIRYHIVPGRTCVVLEHTGVSALCRAAQFVSEASGYLLRTLSSRSAFSEDDVKSVADAFGSLRKSIIRLKGPN